ncbi:hypothetical protein [Gorillibacterium sp. sgz5001074]|uniref:hypothetical protein n=1 Tax=Gorillibacterium sp. sgz5001074 TaxID=3446695 RepID=UPI003F680FE8
MTVGADSAKTRYQWLNREELLIPVDSGSLRSDRDHAYKPPRKMIRELHHLTSALEKSHYGQPLDWSAANKRFPKGTVLTITDIESGLRFRGQRRAGSAHADVQPLTKEDSAVMKRIYGGRWSWDRKAVLLDSPDGPVAASMHGMPHGGDGIPGNDFHGHFCIHFLGSVTHGSGSMDPAHQAMVHKAAGRLEEYQRGLSFDGLVDLFVVASNHKDPHLLGILLAPDSPETALLTKEWLDSRLTVRKIDDPKASSPEPEALTGRLSVRLNVWKQGGRSQAITYVWKLVRSSPERPWSIQSIDPEPVIDSLFGSSPAVGSLGKRP